MQKQYATRIYGDTQNKQQQEIQTKTHNEHIKLGIKEQKQRQI